MLKIVLILITCSFGFCQLNYRISPEFSTNSYLVPIEISTKLSTNIKLHHRSLFFHKNYVFDKYLWHNYDQNGLVYASDLSYLYFNDSLFTMKIGRDCVHDSSTAKIFGLKDSPDSPALDQVTITMKNEKYFNFKTRIVRLDNRELIVNENREIINRWYYYKEMNFNILNNLTINLYEGVISTGIERGPEWYYLYPLSSYVMEDKHEISRYDGQDSSYSIGKGDNDNHFTGFSVRYNNNKYQLYSELLVDEWQLDKESRDNMQTVFGFVLSIGYNLYKSNNIIFEYALASPWLYTNRGIFGSLEKHYQPLGLKDPKSQYFGILFTRKVENRQLKFMLRKQHKSYQNMYTKWDAWDNKIDLFEFEKSNSFESSFEYINNDGKYFNILGIRHNLFKSNNTILYIAKNLEFKI